MERRSGVLKPIIGNVISGILLESIVDKKDVCVITASKVKEGCKELELEINWNSKIPTICNSMRELVKYKKANVINEDRDFNGFTISYNISVYKK